MTKKRFVYYEHKGADYILDTPNTELDFIEMLGDALETEEIVDKLNDLNDENKELEEQVGNDYNEANSLTVKIANLEEELNYYKAKCGSCEEGLFQKDKEISKLENENKKLKRENELLSDELEQAKAVINKKWSKYLKKRGICE